MATKTWIGNAHDVKQISTITVALTWAAADTAQITVNTKDIIITVGSTGATTSLVATAIKEALMSGTYLDGTSASSNSTSNAGGQEFGEFAEFTASVSGSVVTIVATEAGKPFTLTCPVDGTAGNGTLTVATPQVATGKMFWDNADNWDTVTVPINDDIVVFRDSDVSCKYGLPTALEVTIQQWMSYTGEVGLPAINVDVIGKPYYEYRQRYVRLTDAGIGTSIAHRFGLGKDGTGCRLFNLKHTLLECKVIVYNTATPLASRVGTKALNICCAVTTSTLNILGGSVDFSSQDGGTSAFLTVVQTAGDSRGITAIHTAGGQVDITAGTMLIGGATAINTINVRGGTLRVENQTGALANLIVFTGSTVEYASTATITLLYLYGGTFDARPSAGDFTITSGTVYQGGRFLDPYDRLVIGTLFQLAFEPSADLQFGGNPNRGIKIVLT